MKKYPISRLGMIPCALALLAFLGSAPAHADNIVAPADFYSSTSFANWYFDCELELGCDGIFGQTAANDLVSIQTGEPSGFLTATVAVPGASFAYSEIDDSNGSPLDFLAFNNGSATGPTTFTFADPSNTTPEAVSEFATTVYTLSNPFTAYVSAYDAQGQLLGTTSASGTSDGSDVCAVYFNCYSAFVGVQDLGSQMNNIASVVITTTQADSSQDNWFAFGTVGVASVPEPGAFVLIAFGAAAVFFHNRRSTVLSKGHRNA